MKNLSFIIPLHNEEEKIEHILKSLEKVILPRGIKLTQVILVDDGSTDHTLVKASLCAQRYPKLPIIVVSYRDSLGFDKAKDEGKKHSKANYNVVLKSDLSNLHEAISRLEDKAKKLRRPRKPLISVVMPVTKPEKYLSQAVRSILRQTIKDFELIIYDDHSSEANLRLIKKLAEANNKIRVYENTRRFGAPTTLKRAIDQARGQYIAIASPKEISLPTRLERQISHLEANQKIVAVGGNYLILSNKRRMKADSSLESEANDAYNTLYFNKKKQLNTLTIAIKRLPNDFNSFIYEDFELLLSLFKYGQIENISDQLFVKRLNKAETSLLKTMHTYSTLVIPIIKGITMYEYRPDISSIITLLRQKLATKYKQEDRKKGVNSATFAYKGLL